MSSAEAYYKKIQRLADIAGLSIAALSDKAGFHETTLYKYKGKNPSSPSVDVMDELSRAAGFQNYDDFILKETLLTNSKVVIVDSFATIPSTEWRLKKGNPIQIVPDEPGNYVGAHITGQAINRFAGDGSIAIVNLDKNTSQACLGQLIIFQCDGEVRGGIYKNNPTRLESCSTDPSYSTIYPKGEFNIIGLITGVYMPIPKSFL